MTATPSGRGSCRRPAGAGGGPLAGIIGVLFWMNWKMALVLFSITPFIVLVSIWFRLGARATYRQVRARLAALNAFLQERITGMATVQLFRREARDYAAFDEIDRFVVGALVAPEGVDFGALDGQKAHVFIIRPQPARNKHLQILSAVSRVFD